MHDRLSQETSDSRNLAQTALHYPLANPSVAVIIPGASSLEQLKSNVMAADVAPLTSEELADIQQMSKANRYKLHV